MKKLTLALLLCLLIVGAWGQTTGVVTSVTSSRTGRPAHWVCDEGYEMDQVTSYDYPWCHKSHDVEPKPEPEDVPAIRPESGNIGGICDGTTLREVDGCSISQEKVWIDKKACIYKCIDLQWTCADRSRTLLSSEDGNTHYCHKPQLEQK